MSSLEKRKKQLELKRVQMAKEELLFKIDERKEDIARIEEHIKVQEKRELELIEEIKNT